MDTKRRFGKLGGNVAYHGYQSFVTGEVTPEEAHQIGLETARRMWGEEYEIVVTTHLNTDNIHNHIIINSVSFKTGRKFENHIRDHIRLREISDEVCREHGKSVIPFSHFYGNKKAHWIHQSGQLTHRDILRRDLDEAISKCSTFQAIERYLKGLGYRFERDFRYQYPSIKAEGWRRAVRLQSLGEEYSKDSIRQKMIENQRKPELYAIIIPSWNTTFTAPSAWIPSRCFFRFLWNFCNSARSIILTGRATVRFLPPCAPRFAGWTGIWKNTVCSATTRLNRHRILSNGVRDWIPRLPHWSRNAIRCAANSAA